MNREGQCVYWEFRIRCPVDSGCQSLDVSFCGCGSHSTNQKLVAWESLAISASFFSSSSKYALGRTNPSRRNQGRTTKNCPTCTERIKVSCGYQSISAAEAKTNSESRAVLIIMLVDNDGITNQEPMKLLTEPVEKAVTF